ncbi:cyclin-D3-1-like [Typha latifolia]|uniref:cyclin-D3-1-like n=1 Tax=Typha latifolia TaxID=4733 RepID=UPI003C2BB4F1
MVVNTYDFASSTLLCGEDNNSILCFEEEEEVGLHGEAENHELDRIRDLKSGLCWDFLIEFSLQSEECIALLVEREFHHLPGDGYAERLQSGALKLSVRRDAIDWIWKVHSHCNFGPLSVYLSVNYLDRFLSAYELPQDKAWMTQLLSVACLSLAVKMEETECPLCPDLQVGEAKYVFEARTIERMELLVLSTLKWRMQAVTPLSFIDYFLTKYNDGKPPPSATLSRSVELILSTLKGIVFLQFRPSEIAAAAALSAVGEIRDQEITKSLSRCIHVDKERVFRCYEVIQKLTMVKRRGSEIATPLVASMPQSPIGVLDTSSLTYKSDDILVGSDANQSPASKRRKLCRP